MDLKKGLVAEHHGESKKGSQTGRRCYQNSLRDEDTDLSHWNLLSGQCFLNQVFQKDSFLQRWGEILETESI